MDTHIEADNLSVSIVPLAQSTRAGVDEVLNPKDVVESVLCLRHMYAGLNQLRHTYLEPAPNQFTWIKTCIMTLIPVDTVYFQGFRLEVGSPAPAGSS